MSNEIEQPLEGSVGEVASGDGSVGVQAENPTKARQSRRLIFISFAVVIAALATWMLIPKSSRRTTEVVSGNFNGLELHAVDRMDFDMIIPVSGELAALRQVEVRNLLDRKSVV